MLKGKEISEKLTKDLLDIITLQLLSTQPMHGYQIIAEIRKNFGVTFGASTVYPLLGMLEKKGYIVSRWDMTHERPRKVFSITQDGQGMLNFIGESLDLMCRRMTINRAAENKTNGIKFAVQSPRF